MSSFTLTHDQVSKTPEEGLSERLGKHVGDIELCTDMRATRTARSDVVADLEQAHTEVSGSGLVRVGVCDRELKREVVDVNRRRQKTRDKAPALMPLLARVRELLHGTRDDFTRFGVGCDRFVELGDGLTDTRILASLDRRIWVCTAREEHV